MKPTRRKSKFAVQEDSDPLSVVVNLFDVAMVFAVALDWGVEINLSHTSTQVAGCTVHNVDNGALAACFDKAVPRAVVEYIANLQPLRAVFRDSAFATDAEKINVTEIFKNLSPDTKVKVI